MLSLFEKFFKILMVLFLLTVLGASGLVRSEDESLNRDGIQMSQEACGSKAQGDAGDPESLRKKMLEQKRAVETFSDQETNIIDELNRIDLELNRKRRQAAAMATEMNGLKRDIEEGLKQKKRLQKDIEEQRHYTDMRLNALYRVSVMGRMEMSAMPDSVFSFFLQQKSLEQILSCDFAMLKTHQQNFKTLTVITKELETKQNQALELGTRLNDQIEVMTEQSRRRGLILDGIREKKRLALAAFDALEEAARDLDKKIDFLNQSKEPLEETTWTFAGAKGGLDLPVKGNIISEYGPIQNSDDSAFTFQSGIDISVDKGEPVMSVFKGRIIFAQWLKGYGNLVIIDHGGHYYTLYAHVEESFKKKGDLVAAGEVIAIAGDTGSIKGPYLHFEVRYHGKPVDPMAWLKKGVLNEERL